MKKLEKILTLLSFALAAISAVMYAVFFEKNTLRNLFMVIFFAALLTFLFFGARYAKRSKIIKRIFSPILEKIRSVYRNVAKKVKKILPKSHKTYASGKDEFKIKFAFFTHEKTRQRAKAKQKLPNYNSLETDKERVRYLYTAFLYRKAERGYRIDSARTPNEISKDFAGNQEVKALFDAYPIARYADAEETISKETLEYLEKSIEH